MRIENEIDFRMKRMSEYDLWKREKEERKNNYLLLNMRYLFYLFFMNFVNFLFNFYFYFYLIF